MPSTYNPFNWFWLADDGRIFGSAKQLIVDATDPDYIAWTGTNVATPWPRDIAGNQTDQSLQDVLTSYNLWIDLTAYTANARYNRASGGVVVTSLGGSVPFLSDPQSRNTVNSAYDFMTQKGTGYTVHWKLSDGSFVVLNTTQMTLLMNDMATFVQSCFACEANTVASINGGTITTQAQIDAAFAAISNVFA
jgi:hypothetical protein